MSRTIQIRVLALFALAAAATAAHHATTAASMQQAAEGLLATLSAEQASGTRFEFDSELRTTWHFVPGDNFGAGQGYPRKGITYGQMSPEQDKLADALLSSGLSKKGFAKATTIMSLEEVLRKMENAPPGRRDVEMYHYSVFGDPSASGTWGWRAEGHHMSLNFTLRAGKVISASPTFFGANPHEVREGPRKGTRVLGAEGDVARALMVSLNAGQRKQALIADKAYKDIVTAADTRAKIDGEPQGLPASKLDAKQFEALMSLIAVYAGNVPAEVAADRMKKAKDTDKEKLFFAWAGSIEPGAGDYYRVQAPTFLIEYDNTQNDNNHSHTVWRDWEGDFGLDMLALHHQLYDHQLAD